MVDYDNLTPEDFESLPEPQGKRKIFEALDGITPDTVQRDIDTVLVGLSRRFLDTSDDYKSQLSEFTASYLGVIEDIYEEVEVFTLCRLLFKKVPESTWPKETQDTYAKLQDKYDFDDFIVRFVNV